jgi:hypothetical protein
MKLTRSLGIMALAFSALATGPLEDHAAKPDNHRKGSRRFAVKRDLAVLREI